MTRMGLPGLMIGACFAAGQQSTDLQFDVASVKPYEASAASVHASIAREPGRVAYNHLTVRGLMREAWGLKVYPLSRGPDELSTERYDVIATAPANASKEQIMLMLQSLLKERFKLVIHRETRELPLYALVAAKAD